MVFCDAGVVCRFFWRLLALWFLLAGFSRVVGAAGAAANSYDEVGRHLGQWIWGAQAADKQTCRLWKAFVIPEGMAVTRATVRITVDNGYRLFLDGREIGRGSRSTRFATRRAGFPMRWTR